jgi:Protein of unknown function (DUF1654).
MPNQTSPGVVCQLYSPYESLILRIHRQINSSNAQDRRQTVITLQPGESLQDWDTFLDELDMEESVRVTHIETGAAHLRWTNQHFSRIAYG